MEEVIINEPSLFQTLVSSPTTYIVLLIVAMTIYQLKKGKSSSKCCESNKTSTPTKQVAKKPVAKKNTSKKPVAKKMPKKKTTAKRTPKKGGK